MIGAAGFGALGPDHCSAAVALWRAAGLTRPWNDPEADYDRAIAGPHSTVLGGFGADDTLVATIMVGEDSHRGWFYYLAVDPARRGQGLGRAAVAAAEAWLTARGLPKAQLMVRDDNSDARAFYAAIGYEPAEVTVFARRLDR